MITTTLSLLAPSGAPASGFVIQSLTPGNTSGASYIAFLGAGGPGGTPFAVLVNSYQSTTYITSSSGNNLGGTPYGVKGSGQLTNVKFVSATTAKVNSDATGPLLSVPEVSGTLLMRLVASSAIQTQNALVRCVNLNASSGIADESSIVTNLDVRGAEISKDVSWTQIGGNSALDNRLFLADHNTQNITHDWHIGLSVSPESIGLRNDFGIFLYIEFL